MNGFIEALAKIYEGLTATETRSEWTIYGKRSYTLLQYSIVEDFMNIDNLGLTKTECIQKKIVEATKILEKTTKTIEGENRYETGLQMALNYLIIFKLHSIKC